MTSNQIKIFIQSLNKLSKDELIKLVVSKTIELQGLNDVHSTLQNMSRQHVRDLNDARDDVRWLKKVIDELVK